MDKMKQNREFIIRYLNDLSGVIKTEELCREYTTDEGLIEHILFFDGAFPKYELFMDEMVADEERVIVRGRVIGIHTGEFNGIPPTQNKIDLPFVIRYTVKNEIIVDHWLMADQMILMEQLGVIDKQKEHQVQI